MAAPTPVSAYLHSATMVKAGVYLLARLHPVLGGTEAWFYALTLVGGFTGLLGAWLAWQQTDLKRIMAYTTISALGVLVFLLGLGGVSDYALKAAVVFLITHSLYKGALFMIAGTIDHETGTREVTQLGGLARVMPYTFIALLLATLSMAGVPPLIGFVGKELIYEATLESQRWLAGTSIVALLTNILVTTAAAIILIGPFLKGKAPANVHEGAWQLWFGPNVLGLLAVLAGLFVGSALFADQLVQPAVQAIAGEVVKVKLYLIPTSFALWHHGAPSAFALSLLTWLVGAVGYVVYGMLRPWATRLDASISRFGPENGYFKGFDGLLEGAAMLTRTIQNGHLRRYLLYVCLTVIVLLGTAIFFAEASLLPLAETTISEWLVGALIVGGVLMVVLTDSRMAAVAAMGVVGYGIAMLYAIFNAPDLALTQLSIETLTVILFVLVLYRLPHFSMFSNRTHKMRDAALAIGVGVVMAGLVLLVTSVPGGRPLTEYYAANSYVLAKGRNVVNVILVDFRGLDTLVEITVLTVSALGVYALIHAKRHN
jgi:multicomponent Na+:H+ antiporter subunit A